MPCGSEAWKFVWWAAGDNGGRSTWDFLRIAGCPDLKAYDSVVYKEAVGASWNDYYWSNMRSHTQGIPPELKGYPVISNTRNPYAKTISNFADRISAMNRRRDLLIKAKIRLGESNSGQRLLFDKIDEL